MFKLMLIIAATATICIIGVLGGFCESKATIPYELKVEQVLSSDSVSGPVSLRITVTYRGDESVTIYPFQPAYVKAYSSFITPEGWKQRKRGITGIVTCGRMPPDTVLAKDQSVSAVIDLKEFFPKMNVGTTTLDVTLYISPVKSEDKSVKTEENNKTKEPASRMVPLHTVVQLVLTDEKTVDKDGKKQEQKSENKEIKD
jgi:hypothetical protein